MTGDKSFPYVLDALEFHPRLDPDTRRNAELMGLLAERQWRSGRRRVALTALIGAALIGLGLLGGVAVHSGPRFFTVALGLLTVVLCLGTSVALAISMRRLDRRLHRRVR